MKYIVVLEDKKGETKGLRMKFSYSSEMEFNRWYDGNNSVAEIYGIVAKGVSDDDAESLMKKTNPGVFRAVLLRNAQRSLKMNN